MNDIDMLFCIVLMVLGAFLIYYPMKDESPRQKLKSSPIPLRLIKRTLIIRFNASATFWTTWRPTMGKVRL